MTQFIELIEEKNFLKLSIKKENVQRLKNLEDPIYQNNEILVNQKRILNLIS